MLRIAREAKSKAGQKLNGKLLLSLFLSQETSKKATTLTCVIKLQ